MGKMTRAALELLPLSVSSRLVGLKRSLRSVDQGATTASTEEERFRAGFPSLRGLLQQIRDNGFAPTTILDVGANAGEWSSVAASIFTSSRILMFDGDPQNEPALNSTVKQIGSRSQYHLGLLGAEKKAAVTFYRPETGTTGSSLFPELTSFGKQAITLSMDTLDSFVEGAALNTPLLLKLDVQGYELEILKGAKRSLGMSEVVILETSLLPYNSGAPLFAEVVAFMNDSGFAVFDFCGQNRRQTDHVLFQTDVVFVRHESALRAQRKFWLGEP